uniref:Inorganic phosphate cotransporter n=1 Tax=Timema shepardi TaxID=629360 RepID=A0A7R9FY50_TIMSH|nr:unnamed protein product [Timema shepardi]
MIRENRKTTPNSFDRDLNLDLPILGSLPQHEPSALANLATEALRPLRRPKPSYQSLTTKKLLNSNNASLVHRGDYDFSAGRHIVRSNIINQALNLCFLFAVGGAFRCIPARYVVLVIGSIGVIFQFQIKVSLSVAIVAMVKSKNTTESNFTEMDTCPNAGNTANSSSSSQEGEFEWSESMQGVVLSAFYYGYVSTQLLCGWLSDKFGTKMVMGVGMMAAGILNLLSPLAAKWDVGALITLRVLQGMFCVSTFPTLLGPLEVHLASNNFLLLTSRIRRPLVSHLLSHTPGNMLIQPLRMLLFVPSTISNPKAGWAESLGLDTSSLVFRLDRQSLLVFSGAWAIPIVSGQTHRIRSPRHWLRALVYDLDPLNDGTRPQPCLTSILDLAEGVVLDDRLTVVLANVSTVLVISRQSILRQFRRYSHDGSRPKNISDLSVCSIPVIMYIGSITSMSLSGVLSDISWELVFYVYGTTAIIWSTICLLCLKNSPEEHPYITKEEMDYIMKDSKRNIKQVEKPSAPVPWIKLFTSMPVWATILMQTGGNYVSYTFLSELPTYTKNILNYNVSGSGIVSSLPYISAWIGCVGSGYVSQWLQEKKYITRLTSYRIFNGIGALGPAICVITISLIGCNTTAIIALLVLTMFTYAMFYGGGSVANFLDLGINYAGTLSGITLTVANSMGIIAPLVTGALTDGNQTRAQWKIVFYIATAFSVAPFILFMFCGSTEEQSWNKQGRTDKSENQQLELMQDTGLTESLSPSSWPPKSIKC